MDRTARAGNLEVLRCRIADDAADAVSDRFATLLQALTLSKQNTEAKDQRATIAVKIELHEDGEGWFWTVKAPVSHPSTDPGEETQGNYNPAQPELPGTQPPKEE
jgi:hypothetical protein